jgi:hypothetical protein
VIDDRSSQRTTCCDALLEESKELNSVTWRCSFCGLLIIEDVYWDKKFRFKDKDRFILLLGEAFHTAFRKATDCSQAMQIHRLIDQMPAKEWQAVLEFVAEGMGVEH